MCNSPHPSLTFVRVAAFALAATAMAAAAARDVAFDAQCAPTLTRLEQRLYDRANEGTDALRRFVWIRRSSLQLDVLDTAAWAEKVRNARAACLNERR